MGMAQRDFQNSASDAARPWPENSPAGALGDATGRDMVFDGRPAGSGPALVQALLAFLGEPPALAGSLDEAATLENVQHRVFEDEVISLVVETFKGDPFRIGQDCGMFDEKVLCVH